MGEGNTVSVRRAANWVIIAVLVAAGVRTYLVSIMPTVSRDGVTFIWYAQRLATAPLEEIRREKQHPLYPALIAAAQGALNRVGVAGADEVRRWIMAGESVAFAASLALVAAVYLLAAVLFGRRVGVVAAACAALLPEFARYGVDVLSDTLHLTLYVLALTAGLSGLLRRTWWRLGLAGLLSGMAFLVRPEGGEAALVILFSICVARGWAWRRRLGGAVACLAGLLMVAGPYMLATGHVVQKKSLRRFIGADAAGQYRGVGRADPRRSEGSGLRCGIARLGGARDAGSSALLAFGVGGALPVGAQARTGGLPAAPARDGTLLGVAAADVGVIGRGSWSLLYAAGKTLLNWVRSLRVMYLLPAAAWLLLGPRRPKPSGVWWVVLMAWGLHAAVCVLLIRSFGYWDLFSVRHVLVLTVLTLPWAAAGLVGLVDWACSARQSWLTPARASALVAVVVVGPTLPWLLRAPNTDYAYLRHAGEWIGARYPRPQYIMTDLWHVPLYARARFCSRYVNGQTIQWPGTADADALVAWIRQERPTLVVLDEPHLRRENARFFDDLDRVAAGPGLLRLVHKVPAGDARRPKQLLVYEVHL
jgi:4-amino-4-deoxy-L-arabinose transferase-like glycosyltransferase